VPTRKNVAILTKQLTASSMSHGLIVILLEHY